MNIKNVRLSFPSLFEATSMDDSKPKYRATLILPKDHPQLEDINAAIEKCIKEKWGKDRPSAKVLKICLRDGEEKEMDGFGPEVMFFNASNVTRPTVLDRDKSPLTEKDGKPYAGCYVNVVVDFWAQDNQYGKRVNASLGGVQFVRDGDAFGGGRPASADDFEDEDSFDDEGGGAESYV